MRQLRECHPAEDLNLPFEESEMQMLLGAGGQQSGGVVVLAGSIDSALGKFPVLVFRFVQGDGLTFYPDMTLIGDDTLIRNTAALVQQSAASAIKACRE
jgi:hypothetical protein